ncbi:MAG TPA: hypothetical protein VFX76_16740, partial [Roseiflexaceae bacterium]|nr:hypothetical protein [Roseiflexaceae bacterium]
METPTHTLLKRLSVEWLRARGYLAAACEVRSPIAQWVLDVAGWRDAWWDAAAEQRIKLDSPQTAIIECKQSRADFLRDSRRLDALIHLRQRYEGIRRSIEEHRIKALEPQLRQSGSSLFAELEEWDFESSALPSYRRTLARLEQIDARLHGETKFIRISQYGLADALYIAAPFGMIAHRELPQGWGLLELAEDGTLTQRRESTAIAARPRHR